MWIQEGKIQFQKKEIVFVWVSFLTSRPPYYVILCCCLRLQLSPSQVTYLLNGCMVMFYVMISWVNCRKYENLLQFIIQYIILDFVLLLLSSSTPFPFPSDVLTPWLYGDVLCDDIMSKQSKIWKSLAIYYSIFYFRLCLGVAAPLRPLSLWPCQGWMETVHSEMVAKLCS